jgi:hypothetical protein
MLDFRLQKAFKISDTVSDLLDFFNIITSIQMVKCVDKANNSKSDINSPVPPYHPAYVRHHLSFKK